MKPALLALAIASLAAPALAGAVEPGAVVFDETGAVATPLAEAPGDPKAGKKVFSSRALGNCVACHSVTSLTDVQWHGEVGPVLDGIGARRSAEELRGIVADAKRTFEGSAMPSFYRTTGFIRPGDGYTGKAATEIRPILSAQEIEDVVAFLATLTD